MAYLFSFDVSVPVSLFPMKYTLGITALRLASASRSASNWASACLGRALRTNVPLRIRRSLLRRQRYGNPLSLGCRRRRLICLRECGRPDKVG